MKRIAALLLAVLMAFSVMPPAFASGSSPKADEPALPERLPAEPERQSGAPERTVESGVCGADLTWSLDTDTGVLTVSGTGGMSDYEYNNPDNMAPWSAYAGQITAVVVESGVTSIGACAFFGCTAIKSIELPSTLLSLGFASFYQCTSLEGTIILPEGIASIGDYCFFECSALTEIFLPASLRTIGMQSFYNCTAMVSIGMKEGLETIGAQAFVNCTSLKRVYIPASVTGIGDYAFAYCTSLGYFCVFGEAPSAAAQDPFYEANRFLNVYCFEEYYSSWSAWTTKTVQTLPAYYCGTNTTWSYDPATTTLTISGTGTTDAYEANFTCPPWYAYTHDVTTVTFADGALGPGNNAFRNMDRITTINIPASMTYWGSNCFSGCSAVSTINVDPASTEFALIDGVLYSLNSGNPKYLRLCPASKTGPLTIPSGVTNVFEDSFQNTGVTSIAIPSTISNVVDGAFKGNTALVEFTGSSVNIKTVDGVLFYGTSILRVFPQGRSGEYTVPDSVTQISSYAFCGASSLTKVNAAHSKLTQLDKYAFSDCTSLTEVTLYSPTVNSYCFSGCSNLETVTFNGAKPTFSADAFTGLSPNFKIRYSEAYASSWAPNGETSITVSGVVIPIEPVAVDTTPCGDSLSYYYDEAACKLVFIGTGDMYDYNETDNLAPWHGCAADVTQLVFPAGMTGIGEYAFLGCTKLSSVTLPASLTRLGLHAFKGCLNINSLSLASGSTSFYAYNGGLYTYDRTTLVYQAPKSSSGNPYLSTCTAIGPYAYEGASGFSTLTIGSNIVSIGEGAYAGCPGLTSVTMPESLTSVGAYSFSNCPLLASVTFNSAAAVGDNAFNGCSALESVIFLCEPPAVFGTGVFDNCAAGFKIQYLRDYASSWAPNGETVWNGYPIESYRLPNPTGQSGNITWEYDYETHILYLDASASYSMSNYSTSSRPPWYVYKDECVGVEMRPKVLSVGKYAFADFTALEWVHYTTASTSSSVVINQYAFYHCSSLTDLTCPNGLYKIDAYAFEGCTALTSFFIPRSTSSISNQSFINCTALESITVDPKNSYYVSFEGLLYTSHFATLVSIPAGKTGTVAVANGVTTVGANCVYRGKLSTLILPAGVTTISNSAFRECADLDTVVFLGPPPTSIGSTNFFANCNAGLTFCYLAENASSWAPAGETTWQGFPMEVWQGDIPAPVGEFSYYLLYSYDEATHTITLMAKDGYTDTSTTQTSFSSYSWYGFRGEIEHVVIDASVPCVAEYLFKGWTNLEDVTVDQANDFLTVQSGILYTKNMTTLICCPMNHAVTDFVIPEGVTRIANGAFAGNGFVEHVTIPASVTAIGSEAFKDCAALIEAQFNGNPPSSFGTNVFTGAWRYFRVAYPAENASAWAPDGETTWKGYTAVTIGTPPYDPTLCGDNVHYFFDEATGVLRILGEGAMWDYNNSDNKTPWRLDYQNEITSIVIENGVTAVCAHAFRDCANVASVSIGSTVETIGAYAFYGCSETSVDLPASLTDFTRTSFGGNDNLAAINIDAGNAVFASIDGVVFNKSKDTLLLFPRGKAGAYIVPTGTGAIEAYAFSEAQAMTSVAFPSTLLTVGSYAFYSCPALETVNMTASQLLSIPTYMCYGCAALATLNFSNATVEIGDRAFSGCTSIVSIVLGSSVETVGKYAFTDCTGAVSVFIPASVRTIDEGAFCDCTSLTNLNIAEGLVTIGQRAFSDCRSLESVAFPTTVDDIGGWAFTDCSNLKSATFKGGHPYSFGNYVFSNCADGFCIFYTHAYVGEWNPEGDTVTWRDYPIHEELPCEPFGACDEDTEWDYDYANHVLYIRGSGDMPNYSAETPVPWAPFLTDIHCVVVEEGVTGVGAYSFAGMTMLYEATLPEGIIQIPSGCFEGCTSLYEINFSSSVTSIASDAFKGCTGIHYFCFPSTVTSIGVRAFYGSGLYEAVFEADPPISFGSEAFDECDPDFHIVANADYMTNWDGDGDLMWNGYPIWFYGGDFCGPRAHWTFNDASNTIYFSGTGEMYDYLEGTATWALSSSAPWNDYRQEIEHAVFMDGITYISSGCFSSFPNLRDVYIAGSVKGMGTHAFYDVALDSITIEDGLEWISFWSFSAMSVPVIVFPESFLMLPQEGVDCCEVQEVYFLGDCPFQDELDYQPFRGTGCVVYYYPSHKENWEAAFASGLGCNKPCYMVYDPNDNTCGDLTWSFDEATGTLSFYGTGAMEDYNNNAPWFKHLEQILYVSLPEGVTHIGANAFAGCVYLESVTIPSTVESIGGGAFSSCGLTSISFPASVTSIGPYAFCECSGLTSVTIPATVTEIGICAFERCDSLEEAYLPGLLEVPDYLFASCSSLETVVLCDDAVSIGGYAFAWCNNLTNIDMPSALESIGEGAFQCCENLVSVDLPEGLETIGEDAFIDCYALHDVTIPSTVTEIGGSAFFDCQSLESIEIPAGVTEIASCTFMYCYALTSVTLHEGLEVIGVQAFEYCNNLMGVRLPSTLTGIGGYAFSETGLRRVTIPAGCRTFGQGVFCWCSNLSLVIVDGPVMTDEDTILDFLYGIDDTVVIGYYPDNASSWAPNGETEWHGHPLMRIDNDNEPCGDSLFWSLSNGVLSITGTGEMYNFTAPTGGYPAPWADDMAGITSIVISEGVVTVGAYAFYGCAGVSELYLPDGLMAVLAHAFENCTNLASVSFPASCTGVDDHAFCGCSDLITLGFREAPSGGGELPVNKGLYNDSQFYYVGAYAFYGTGLTRVVLPASVGYIGEHAFGGCGSLNCVTFEGYPPSLDGEEIFDGAASGFHIEYLPEHASDWAPEGETEWNGYPIVEQGAAVYWTVTFVDWDGTVLDTQTVANGEGAAAPADPTREGYTFAGWDVDFSSVTENLTVTATYIQNTPEPTATPEPTPTPTPEPVYYTVTFVDYDGTVIDTQTVAEGGAAAAPADPAREGYTFTGWDADFTSVTGNLTVTAQYQINIYTVTWIIDGVYETETYPYGATPAHADPEKEPDAQFTYTFAGWTPEIHAVNGDEIYVAVFTETLNTYTVTFVDWDGAVIDTQTVAYGGAATAPADPTREGYTFIGWDAAFNYITGNLVVTAQYTINTYTVTFVDWDGAVLDTQTVNYGGAAAAPADPTREGYTFIGWDVAFNYITGDLVVTAQYEENEIPSDYLKGDVNCDGFVDTRDLALAAAIAMNAGSTSAQGVINGDMNGDGLLNSSDLSSLAAYIGG